MRNDIWPPMFPQRGPLRNAIGVVRDTVAALIASSALDVGHRAYDRLSAARLEMINIQTDQEQLHTASQYTDECLKNAQQAENAPVMPGRTEADKMSVSDYWRREHEKWLALKARSATEMLSNTALQLLRAQRRTTEAALTPLVKLLDRYYVPSEDEQLLADADEHQGLGIFESSRSLSNEPIEYVRWRR